MPDDAKRAWNEVGERFTAWGKRVAELHEETSRPGAADETERELQRVAKEIVDAISRGVETVGKTVRDQRAGKELTEALNAFGDAITATAHDAGDAIRGTRGATPPPPRDDDGADRPDA